MKFVGRTQELQLLERAYASGQSAFIPVYGRRRVGKSELLLRFLEGKAGLYYLGKRAPGQVQLREFLEEAAERFRQPLLAELTASGWKKALLAVVEAGTRDGKLALVLDEFQWLAEACPELVSVLQECWDRRWRASGKVLLVLCGSFIGFMEREVLGRKSPLFGRRTAQIHLAPFDFREAAEFHPGWSLVEKAKAWFVCGGIPLYLRHFSPSKSVERNLADLILHEHGALFREPDFLLREELREVESYSAVLHAVANGAGTLSEIARLSAVPERSLPYYLGQLVQLGYVGRRQPLYDRKPGRREGRYDLQDPLLRFWFRFVFGNLSRLAQAGVDPTFAGRIRPQLDSYFGSCFERMCREALPGIYRKEGVAGTFQVGEYWDKRMQIDVVGLRDDHWTDLGESRWGRVRSAAPVVAELEGKIAGYPNDRNATLGLRVFTRDPVRPPPAAAPRLVTCHCLEDLYDTTP
jgi:AAA+ ATPase superfamily predicted ATPase